MKIDLVNLTKIFEQKGQEPCVAVNNLNIDFPDGKLISLLGPSGCGKSTTLFMISGLKAQTEGQILFDGEDVSKLSPERRGVGLVFQNYALYPHLTVEKNIKFPLQNMHLPKQECTDRAYDAAKLVQIEELMKRKPGELSGGQQQRVAIARALVKQPAVLLLDEPLSNLDARLRLQTREEIKRIQQETGVTTIFVTHDQEEAMSISDEIVVIKKGVLQQIGEPQSVYDDPDNLFVAKFLGTPPINVFRGKVSSGKLYIGDEAIMDVKLEDRAVYVAIRPEGFIVDDKGVFTTNVRNIEIMGRDKSIIGENENCEKPTFRAIISAEVDVKGDTCKFSLKPNKVFVFDAETEMRLR